MSSVPFDPYHKWLGIPQRDQPAHHYRLLGIPLYEDDVQVVEAAADRQMAFLRKFQSGEHSADAMKLLNEVSRARICLLKPEAKAAYDETLRATLKSLEPAVVPAASSSTGSQLPSWATPPVLAGAGVALAVLVVGVVLIFSSSTSVPPPQVAQSAVANPTVPPEETSTGGASQNVPAVAGAPKAVTPQVARKDVSKQAGPSPQEVKKPSPTKVASSSNPDATLQNPTSVNSDRPSAAKMDTQNGVASATDPSAVPQALPTVDSEGEMPADSAQENQRLPTPDAAAQDAARKGVRDSLKVEYALAKKADGKNQEARINLARMLMSRVESSGSNPAESYVMLSDAAELAAESGQLSLAWEILNDLGDRFDVPSLPLMERAAKAASKFAKSEKDIAYLASMYVLLLDEAVRLDDFETAAKAASAASGATRKVPSLKEQLAVHGRRVNGLREAFELAKPAREVLKVHPDDQTASLAWGRYLCFYKGDWQTGLPLLAQSSDATLASLAKREVEQPRDLQPLIQLGDDWWDVAEEEKEPVKSAIHERAADAWQLALPLASGLQKKALETKVERIFKPTKFFETTGSGQGVKVANPDLNPGPLFTVEFWVATKSKSGILISKREDARDSGIVLGLDRGRPAFRIGESRSTSQTGRSSRQAINDGRWHHIAIVKLGSRLGLFVDGKWTAQTEHAENYLSGSPWKVGHDGQTKQAEPIAKFCRLRFSKDARYLLSFHPEKNYTRDKTTTFIP